MRLSPDANDDWTHNNMPFYIGGAELNVATALARWKLPVSYVTALPNNYLSNKLIRYIDHKNIDSSGAIFSGNRIGIYYLPIGYELRNAVAFYDRDHTSFSGLKPGVIDWDKVFADCTWFHFSAISPALNENVAAVCKEALEAAVAKGLTVSVDLNFREKLWKYDKQPFEVMPELVKSCNVIMGNLWSVERLLNIQSSVKDSSGKTQEELVQAADESMDQLQKQYPKASILAFTYRMQHEYWAVFQEGTERKVSKKYSIENVIDKVGSGDCFMAGLIYGLYHKHTSQDIIDYAVAAAIGKLQETGDATRQTIEEVKRRIERSSIV